MTPDTGYSEVPGDFPPEPKRMENTQILPHSLHSLTLSPPNDPAQSPCGIPNYYYPMDANTYQNMYQCPNPWWSMHIYQTPQWPFAMQYAVDPSSGQPSPTCGPNLHPMMPPMVTSPVFGPPQMFPMGSPNYPMMGTHTREETAKTGRKFPKYVEDTLIARYTLKPYCEKKDREALAQQLNLKPEQVKIWFQNRRYKDKKRGVVIDQQNSGNSGINQQGGRNWNN